MGPGLFQQICSAYEYLTEIAIYILDKSSNFYKKFIPIMVLLLLP